MDPARISIDSFSGDGAKDRKPGVKASDEETGVVATVEAMTQSISERLWLFMKLFSFLASIFGSNSPAAETKMVDPKSILFSTPTLNDALPAFQNGASRAGKLFQVHEDDWRQFEAVSATYQDQIERELAAIRDVLATSSVRTKVGDRELTAFRKVHVRKLITVPIKGGVLLSQIASLASNPSEYTGLSLSGSPPVLGGYALGIDGLVVFGQADGDRVLSLCFSSKASSSVNPERARKLLDILAAGGLTVVHWASATELNGADFVAYLTGSPQEQHTKPGVQARQAFEQELGKRGLHFTVDEASGRYRLSIEGIDLLVSIDRRRIPAPDSGRRYSERLRLPGSHPEAEAHEAGTLQACG